MCYKLVTKLIVSVSVIIKFLIVDEQMLPQITLYIILSIIITNAVHFQIVNYKPTFFKPTLNHYVVHPSSNISDTSLIWLTHWYVILFFLLYEPLGAPSEKFQLHIQYDHCHLCQIVNAPIQFANRNFACAQLHNYPEKVGCSICRGEL